jgi:acyl transferase domain-containing protein
MPMCAALQISIVRLLESWGVTPTAVSSHSSGEIAAAYAIGIPKDVSVTLLVLASRRNSSTSDQSAPNSLRYLSASRIESLKTGFTSLENERIKPTRSNSDRPRLGFVFTGQGAQWYPSLGRSLLLRVGLILSFSSEVMRPKTDSAAHASCVWTWLVKKKKNSSTISLTH